METSLVITMARISVLDGAATLALLFHPEHRRNVHALIDAGIVVARRPVPDYQGAWGRLSLTSKGVVDLRFATAKMAGRRVPMRLRQLWLFDDFDGGSPGAHFDRNGTLP